MRSSRTSGSSPGMKNWFLIVIRTIHQRNTKSNLLSIQPGAEWKSTAHESCCSHRSLGNGIRRREELVDLGAGRSGVHATAAAPPQKRDHRLSGPSLRVVPVARRTCRGAFTNASSNSSSSAGSSFVPRHQVAQGPERAGELLGLGGGR